MKSFILCRMPPGTYVSRDKLKELEGEYKFLTVTRRREIAEALEYAKSLGDLSENAEYQDARETQAKVEDRIATLERILKDIVIVEKQSGNVVSVGSVVEILRDGDKTPIKYHIVGSEEANIQENKISNESPIGAALIGGRQNEKVNIKTPKGATNYTIVSVS